MHFDQSLDTNLSPIATQLKNHTQSERWILFESELERDARHSMCSSFNAGYLRNATTHWRIESANTLSGREFVFSLRSIAQVAEFHSNIFMANWALIMFDQLVHLVKCWFFVSLVHSRSLRNFPCNGQFIRNTVQYCQHTQQRRAANRHNVRTYWHTKMNKKKKNPSPNTTQHWPLVRPMKIHKFCNLYRTTWHRVTSARWPNTMYLIKMRCFCGNVRGYWLVWWIDKSTNSSYNNMLLQQQPTANSTQHTNEYLFLVWICVCRGEYVRV